MAESEPKTVLSLDRSFAHAAFNPACIYRAQNRDRQILK
jgi:hypothetical protein